jgi:hypothetical protein
MRKFYNPKTTNLGWGLCTLQWPRRNKFSGGNSCAKFDLAILVKQIDRGDYTNLPYTIVECLILAT